MLNLYATLAQFKYKTYVVGLMRGFRGDTISGFLSESSVRDPSTNLFQVYKSTNSVVMALTSKQ